MVGSPRSDGCARNAGLGLAQGFLGLTVGAARARLGLALETDATLLCVALLLCVRELALPISAWDTSPISIARHSPLSSRV